MERAQFDPPRLGRKPRRSSSAAIARRVQLLVGQLPHEGEGRELFRAGDQGDRPVRLRPPGVTRIHLVAERRVAASLALGALVPHRVEGPLDDRFAFPLGDGRDDVEHHPAGGRPGVDRVGDRQELAG